MFAEWAWRITIILCIFGFICFVYVIAFGAPFLPTLKPKVKSAIELIDLKQDQTLLELGSGDGRVLIEAAKYGINSIGYELNPILVFYSLWLTRKYRDKIQIKWANFWNVKLPKCDGIFVFLLDPYMDKLDSKIKSEREKDLKLVSFAFEIKNKKPSVTKDGLFLYIYS